VKVPTPPVSDKRGALSIFRKGPPSKPGEEKKTDVKDTRGEKDTSKAQDQQKEKEQKKAKEQQRGRDKQN
jgi:hypothetical protein